MFQGVQKVLSMLNRNMITEWISLTYSICDMEILILPKEKNASLINFDIKVREAAKKVTFLVVGPLTGGGG